MLTLQEKIQQLEECISFSSGPFQMVKNPPGEGNGYPLLYSLLENSMDGGAWWAEVHGVARMEHN